MNTRTKTFIITVLVFVLTGCQFIKVSEYTEFQKIMLKILGADELFYDAQF